MTEGRRDAASPLVVGDPRAAELARAVAELENISRFDTSDLKEPSERLAATARTLGLPALEQRARLVQADLLRRRGDVAEGGRRVQEIHRWAVDHGTQRLLARSHFVLAAVFQELGDLSAALENAVRAVELLDDDAAPEARIDSLARLADCLGLSGDPTARDRYDSVLREAEALGDIERQLLIVNNRTYYETLAGSFEEALRWSVTLQDLAARHGVPLRLGRLDTIGRALMELDRIEDAEAAMAPGLSPDVLDGSLDGDGGADFLLTLAEIRRRRGHLAPAQECLDECVRRCDRFGLTSIRVRARREQAELHAAGGDYRSAFEEHKLYTAELTDLQSAERDARARALQAMYETTEARRQTRRYRELSLRDPLTGLYNRRYVDDQLPGLLASTDSLTVALLDLDHFKRINDTCSHETGDRVLRTVADLLVQSVHPGGDGTDGSFVARMGGEEFLLVLVGADSFTGALHLEHVRRIVGGHPWGAITEGLPVTVSIGGVSVTRADGRVPPTPSDLLGRADAHLYFAKRNGRDRVVTETDARS